MLGSTLTSRKANPVDSPLVSVAPLARVRRSLARPTAARPDRRPQRASRERVSA